jgi:hypothetical protein
MAASNNNMTLENMRALSLLVFVLFTLLISQFLLEKVAMFRNPKDIPTAYMGIMGGVIVALVAYLPIKFLYGKVLIDETYAVNLSVLLGLVVAYMMVSGLKGVPDIPTLALLVFLFYFQLPNFIVPAAAAP